MEDWLTYRLSDLLLFSPRTYYRLFELHNRTWWPAHLAMLGAALCILVLARRRTPWSVSASTVLLSGCWLFVGWAFHVDRYATINWAARYFGIAFVLQAALMLWYSIWQRRRVQRPPSHPSLDKAALGLTLFALFLHPVIGLVVGREWTQIETFGITPDPTAIATLGILPLLSLPVPRRLLLIPVLWCAISGATLWAMGSLDAPMVPLLGLTGVVTALRHRRA